MEPGNLPLIKQPEGSGAGERHCRLRWETQSPYAGSEDRAVVSTRDNEGTALQK